MKSHLPVPARLRAMLEQRIVSHELEITRHMVTFAKLDDCGAIDAVFARASTARIDSEKSKITELRRQLLELYAWVP